MLEDFNQDTKFWLRKSECRAEIFSTVDQTITFERVIRATFTNPDRRKFAKNKFKTFSFNLGEENLDVEQLILKIIEVSPNSAKKFNEAKVQLFDTSILNASVNKAQWIADLSKLKWYGPFEENHYGYQFQTATDSGNFEGLILFVYHLHASAKRMTLLCVDKNSNECGRHNFSN